MMLKLQAKIAGGLAGCAILLGFFVAFFAVTIGLDWHDASQATTILVLGAASLLLGLGALLAAGRLLSTVSRGEGAVDDFVVRREREDRRREEALAGGEPGRLSSPELPGGEIAVAENPGASSLPHPRQPVKPPGSGSA